MTNPVPVVSESGSVRCGNTLYTFGLTLALCRSLGVSPPMIESTTH